MHPISLTCHPVPFYYELFPCFVLNNRMNNIPRFIIACIILSLVACSSQEPIKMRIENGWIAEIPPMIRVTAALMTLHNDGDESKFLVAASSPKTGNIEIHQSIIVNDLAKMIQQKSLEIPAQGKLEFTNESGYHLMLYDCQEIKAGNQIPITLEFSDGTNMTVNFEVKDRREML